MYCCCLLAECMMYITNITKQQQISLSALLYICSTVSSGSWIFSSVEIFMKSILAKSMRKISVFWRGEIRLQNIEKKYQHQRKTDPNRKRFWLEDLPQNVLSVWVLNNNSGRLYLQLRRSSRNKWDKIHKLQICVISGGKTMKPLRCHIFALQIYQFRHSGQPAILVGLNNLNPVVC